MEAGAFFLFWVFLGLVVVAVAYARSPLALRARRQPAAVSRSVRVTLLLLAVGIFVALPIAVVSAASDRVPSGAGTYTENTDVAMRDGRLYFRQTCASCHTLEAANARGAYGPNLDTLTGLTPERVAAAIETGVGSGERMPAGLLQGEQAELVAQYVAEVSGAGRN